jgi:hypothetical protein
LFATIVFTKSAGILLPVCVLIKNRPKFFPAENAKLFLTETLTEKTTAAAIAAIAVPAETIAETAAANAPAAAAVNTDHYSKRGDVKCP